MPYIGYNVTNAGSFALIDDIASTFNGSNTAFTLQVGGVNITPNVQNLLIAIDGVVQQAPDAYSVSGSTITFTGAPASGADFYGVLMGQSSYVENNSITADELAVSGDGSSGQLLSSDGDGTFSWLSSSSITSVGTLGSLTTSGSTGSNYIGSFTNTSATGWGLFVKGGADNADYSLRVQDKDAGDLLSVKAGGRVGVLTNDPSHSMVIKTHSSGSVNVFKIEEKDSTDTLVHASFANSHDEGSIGVYYGGTLKNYFRGNGTSYIKGGDLEVESDGARFFVKSATNELVSIGRAGSSGDALQQGYLRMKSGGTNKIAFHTAGDSYITGGSLGIGTSSPSSYDSYYNNLVVYENGNAGISIIGSTSSETSLGFGDGTSADTYRGAVAYVHTSGDHQDKMFFKTSATNQMVIDSSGNVGIGTTSPLTKIDVRNSGNGVALNTTAGTVFESVPPLANNGTYLFGTGGSGSDQPQILTVNSGAPASGNFSGIGFGIKTSSSSNVVVNLAGIAGVKENATDGSGGDVGALAFGTRTSGDYIKERMRIRSDGNVVFKNDIIRFHTDYTNRVYSGYTTGNAGFSVTFPIQDNSSLLITAMFTHYGAGINTYGCTKMCWLSTRDNSQSIHNIDEITSSNGGSWSISTSSSVVTVSKVAGSYVGGGHYWVKIEGSANI